MAWAAQWQRCDPAARLLQQVRVLLDVKAPQEAPQHAETLVALELRRPQWRIPLVRRCDRRVGHRHSRHHGQRARFRRRDGLLSLERGPLVVQPARRRVHGCFGF